MARYRHWQPGPVCCLAFPRVPVKQLWALALGSHDLRVPQNTLSIGLLVLSRERAKKTGEKVGLGFPVPQTMQADTNNSYISPEQTLCCSQKENFHPDNPATGPQCTQHHVLRVCVWICPSSKTKLKVCARAKACRTVRENLATVAGDLGKS